MNWNKNFFHFNVQQWLKQDTASTQPSQEDNLLEQWCHFDAHDILSVPDPWEYPWVAAWDLDFQLVTLSISDPEFAKQQVLLLLDERYMRPDGAIPAFEGDFATPHPPLHAWAAWHVYQMNLHSPEFLQQVYPTLKRHYEWWLKTQQHKETFLFGGGFLGMDNISIFDRNKDVPEDGWLAQADGTSWMLLFTLNMLAIAIELGKDSDAAQYLEHFLNIRRALLQLWDEDSHFFYDVLHTPSKGHTMLKARSLVGLVPLVAVMLLDPSSLETLPTLRTKIEALEQEENDFKMGANGCYLLAALDRKKIHSLLKPLFDPTEFYSPYGIRSLSKYHEKYPLTYQVGDETFTLTYAPGEADNKQLGGNSNWRGPVWAPLNQLLIESLYYYHAYFGEQMRLPGKKRITLEQAASDLVERLIRLFKRDDQGCRPLFGENIYLQSDPHWRDYIWFYEHFHGENGLGLGASHQNGWTAIMARLIQTQGRATFIPQAVVNGDKSSTKGHTEK